MNLYHLPNYAGTGSAAKVHFLCIVIVFSLTREETSSLFVHPQTFLDVNEIFVQFHCLSSYRNDLSPCSHILSNRERLCFVFSFGIFGSKNGVSIFSQLSINTIVAKEKKMNVSLVSYKLEKVLNFSSRLEKSLNLVQVLEKYLISLLGLEKSLKFTTLSTPDTIFCKIRLFCQGKFDSFSV